jgi:hypothetical protein
MRNIKNKIISVLCFAIVWVFMVPITTFAQSEDCNRFWAKCHVSKINTYHTQDEGTNSLLLDTVVNSVNRCMGILATVALCVCMYAWLKMLTSGSDSKWYDAWLKTLKNGLLWLAIILLAWMIVSAVFWFVGTLSGWNQTQTSNIV